jgi:hypothetical protein
VFIVPLSEKLQKLSQRANKIRKGAIRISLKTLKFKYENESNKKKKYDPGLYKQLYDKIMKRPSKSLEISL